MASLLIEEGGFFLLHRFEVGSGKSEVGSRKSEVGSGKSEVGSRKSEAAGGSPAAAGRSRFGGRSPAPTKEAGMGRGPVRATSLRSGL